MNSIETISGPNDLVYMGLPHERYLRPKFWISLSLSLPVFFIAMGTMAAPMWFHQFNADVLNWTQLVLTTPIFFWCGAPFIRRWWVSLRTLDTNMFTLTVTGTGAAYFYSMFAVLYGDNFPPALRGGHGAPLYFEATAFITTVVLLGQIIEQRAHGRTDAAIRALMELAPKIAHRLDPQGSEIDVPLDEVQVGDQLRVHFEGGGIFDQDSGLGSAANTRYERDRGGEAERARAGDDEDGDRVEHAMQKGRFRTK